MIASIDSRAKGGERHGPVHRPGVQKLEPEPPCQRPCRAALPGPGRTVDGDNHRTLSWPSSPLRRQPACHPFMLASRPGLPRANKAKQPG